MFALANAVAVAQRVAVGPGHACIGAQQQPLAQRALPADAERNLETALATQHVAHQPRLQLDRAGQVVSQPQPADQRTTQRLQALGQIVLVHVAAPVDRQAQPEAEAVQVPERSGQSCFRDPVAPHAGTRHARAADRIATPVDPRCRGKGVPHLVRSAVLGRIVAHQSDGQVHAIVVLAGASHGVVSPCRRPGSLLCGGLLSLRQCRTGGSA